VIIAEASVPPDRDQVLRAHAWANRVDALLAAAGVPPPARPGSEPEVVVRPVVHHARRDRRI
jgi:hypothetical protein